MRKTKKYENSFKRQVILEVLSGSVTKEEARKRYEIGGKSTILDWMREYAGLKMKLTGSNPIPLLRDMKEDTNKAELEEKIKQLEARLEYAELKGRAYQIMVEIAKEQYNLDLEKKSGAKQFKNSKKSDQK